MHEYVKGGRGTIKARANCDLKAPSATTPSAADTSPLSGVLARYGAEIQPVAHRLLSAPGGATVQLGTEPLNGLARYHHVTASDEHLDLSREELANQSAVKSPYIKPAGQQPMVRAVRQPVLPPVIPIVLNRQPPISRRTKSISLQAGVDALYAWNVGGGRGAGVFIVDCEWARNFAHEDLAVYLVVDATNQSSPIIADNQPEGIHPRALVGDPARNFSPTNYLLRVPS